VKVDCDCSVTDTGKCLEIPAVVKQILIRPLRTSVNDECHWILSPIDEPNRLQNPSLHLLAERSGEIELLLRSEAANERIVMTILHRTKELDLQ
jgi:hypothetical protein